MTSLLLQMLLIDMATLFLKEAVDCFWCQDKLIAGNSY
jgi:hypothetical protein